MSYPPPPPPAYPPVQPFRRLPPGDLSRKFFERAQIDQSERLPYPEYRYTKYFWLINLQQTAYTRPQAEALMKLLKRVVIEVFTEGKAVAFAHPNHRWDRRYIGSNELKVAIEIGPKTGKIHCHLIQEVKHRSIINIETEDVKRRLNAALAHYTRGLITSVFVSRKLHPSSKPLEEYVDKDNEKWRDNPLHVSGIWSYTLEASPGQTAWSSTRNIRESSESVPMQVVADTEEPPSFVSDRPFGKPRRPAPLRGRPTQSTPATAESAYSSSMEPFLGPGRSTDFPFLDVPPPQPRKPAPPEIDRAEKDRRKRSKKSLKTK